MNIKISLPQIIFILIVIYFIYMVREDLLKLGELKSEKVFLAQNLRLEEQAKENIKKESSSNIDQGDYERIAREQLGFIKKGEVAYKVIFK